MRGFGSRAGSGSVLTDTDADPGGPKHTDPTDPDAYTPRYGFGTMLCTASLRGR
jgi:hypothetical protein